ncbi:MAG TPA: BlaI/MecI/CopY family transcriptional regulator [Bryobacteraceae bacterium]|jgi:BlaI family penicillinase repressor|nr:BlaI/MecI/CopY family transcriptional regulator [Bryobacteraceae bacterium]
MKKQLPDRNLSRRERQMMDILYQRGRATAAEVHELLADPPSYSAVRAKLRVLEEKGHIRHETQAARYIYAPVVARERAKETALRHLLATFFDNSAEQAMTALLRLAPGKFSREKLDELSGMIEQVRKEGHGL